ncbi:DUF6188 family protein [Sphaerisporangium perillae]|uniref:DUF6188 family protein n=1 Tax=Sphaerisporangium perillae TaxID=2935860 RepID=UPI003557B933
MQVIHVRVSYQLTLLLDSGAHVDIEAEAMLSHGPLSAPDATMARLVPERQEVAPALALFGVTVLIGRLQVRCAAVGLRHRGTSERET